MRHGENEKMHKMNVKVVIQDVMVVEGVVLEVEGVVLEVLGMASAVMIGGIKQYLQYHKQLLPIYLFSWLFSTSNLWTQHYSDVKGLWDIGLKYLQLLYVMYIMYLYCVQL